MTNYPAKVVVLITIVIVISMCSVVAFYFLKKIEQNYKYFQDRENELYNIELELFKKEQEAIQRPGKLMGSLRSDGYSWDWIDENAGVNAMEYFR